MLEELKRDNETFDELFDRLVLAEHPIEIGAWSEEEAEPARTTLRRSRERFE